MRVSPLAVVAIVLFLAVSVFLVYGGRAAAPSATAAPSGASSEEAQQRGIERSQDLRPEIQALSKRVEDLAEEVGQLKESLNRTPLTTVPATTPDDGAFARTHRDDVLRLIQEDRDLKAMPQHVILLTQAVVQCCINSGYPDGKPLGESVDLLVEAEKRAQEIHRRVLPADSLVKPTDAQRSQYAQEITTLREWRKGELSRIVGVDAAQKLISALGNTQPLPTAIP